MTDDQARLELLREPLQAYLAQARWFGGKGRPFAVTGLHRLHLGLGSATGRRADEPRVCIELTTVSYPDTSAGLDANTDPDTDEVYQLPLACYPSPVDRLVHALIGEWTDPDFGHVFAYDALHDRRANAVWLAGFDRAEEYDELVFHRLRGHDLDTSAQSTLYFGEQSNSSVVFGEDSLMKVFRRLTPGPNPDIDIHRALTEAGSEHAAALYGWLEAPVAPGADQPLQLAMLQQFLRTASDGWQAALASVRNLFAEGDLHADEVGGDFAGEAHRLGTAVAEVHEALRSHFPTTSVDSVQTAAAMNGRLDAALTDVPSLAAYAEGIRAIFARLAETTISLPAQRVHGDLHLGQALRTSKGWKLVDFEGEPARPLAERMLPDSPWRDVAGMLRSFDYAARAVEHDLSSDPDGAAQLAYRAEEWAERNRAAFLQGYLEQSTGTADPPTAEEQLVTAVYEADKAVYEVRYEARNRPDWIDIPLAGLSRIAKEARS